MSLNAIFRAFRDSSAIPNPRNLTLFPNHVSLLHECLSQVGAHRSRPAEALQKGEGGWTAFCYPSLPYFISPFVKRPQYGISHQKPAETNGGYLQTASPGKYRDKLGLVEEFIVEFEGTRKDCDITRIEASSPTSKTLKKRCLRTSGCTSRSGLIRELNETRAEHLRITLA